MGTDHPHPPTTHHDVVVVGGRCAGAATAMLLAAQGHDVVVVDRVDLPRDTLSTHAIARGGVVQLARWGLLDGVLAGGAPAVREVTFALDGQEVRLPLRDLAGVDLLVAPRRWSLDALLLDAARAAGATTRTGVRITGLVRRPSGRVVGVRGHGVGGDGVELRARYVVGADGWRSTTAGLVGARATRAFRSGVSHYYAYVDGLDARGFEFHVASQGYAGVFPTHDGQSCVWLSRPTRWLEPVRRAGDRRAGALLAGLADVAPTLADRLREAHVASPVRGCVALPSFVRDAFGPGWALVGDAGYHRDPISGHGITDAFRDAELLAAAVHGALRDPAEEGAALAAYQSARDQALDDVFRVTCGDDQVPGGRPLLGAPARAGRGPRGRGGPARLTAGSGRPHCRVHRGHHDGKETSMTTTTARSNGVDVAGLLATVDAVRQQPELARFQFRATTRWLDGTYNSTAIDDFHGACTEHTRAAPFTVDADHPAVLVGADRAPTPAEHLLQALGSCLMSGLANIAAARGIELGEVTARIEGDIDLRGILGLDDAVRNGFENIRVTFHVQGAAEAEQLARLVDQARRRSAVYDVLTRGVPVSVDVATS